MCVPAMGTYLPKKYDCQCLVPTRTNLAIKLLRSGLTDLALCERSRLANYRPWSIALKKKFGKKAEIRKGGAQLLGRVDNAKFIIKFHPTSYMFQGTGTPARPPFMMISILAPAIILVQSAIHPTVRPAQ
jgi:hypothetical protein